LNFDILFQRIHEMAAQAIALLPNLALAVLAFGVFFVGARFVRRLVLRLTARFHKNAGVVVGRLAQLAVVVFGVLVALSIVLPSFKPADVISLLGIGSVAIGFAFRDILQNFLSGILLLLMEPFRIGDQIVVAGFEGTVEEIQTRATLIKTYDGRRVVIPNSTIFTTAVTVNTAFEQRRAEHEVGVGYGDDLERVKALLLEAVRSVPTVLSDPAPDVYVVDLAASWVNVRVRWWTSPPTQKHLLETQSAVLEASKAKLSEAGIDLPFPTQQILFHDQTDEWDGDRAKQREGWPKSPNGPKPANVASALRALSEALGQSKSPPAA
jgi:small conductance mechanosensitive channel